MSWAIKLSQKRAFFVLASIILLSIAWMFVQSPQVHAATTDTALSSEGPVQASGEIYPSGSNFRPFYAVGTGGFDGQFMYVKVYVPTSGTTGRNVGATLTIQQGGGKCARDLGSPDVTYTLEDLSDQETYTTGGFIGGNPISARSINYGCTAIPINIPPGRAVESQIPGHQGYSVFYFQAQINNAFGTNEKEFWLQLQSNSSVPSYVGISRVVRDYGFSATDGHDQGYFAIYKYDAPSNWNYGVQIAPRCDEYASSQKADIRMYDADWGVYSQPQLSASVLTASKAVTPGWSGAIASASGAQLGGNHAYSDAGALSFNAINTNKYKLNVYDVAPINTIQVKVPFDQFDANKPCPTNASATCQFASASTTNAKINDNVAITVSVKNSGNTSWDSSYSLLQTYWSTIDGTHKTLIRTLTPSPPGPGLLAAGQTGTFNFTVTRAYQGTYYFDFQMQQNNALKGSACSLTINFGPTGSPRPDCYIRQSGGPTNVDVTLPYPGGNVTIDAQILNPNPPSSTAWGERYFMTEEHNGVRRNLGYLVSTGGGTYTTDFPQTYNVTSNTTFNYQVWVVPGPPTGTVTDTDLAAFKRVNPPPAIPNSATTGIAAGTFNCPLTVNITPPDIQGSISNIACQQINYEVHWVPALGNAITTIITSSAGGSRTVVDTPGSHSFDPFTDPYFAGIPITQDLYTFTLSVVNADGTVEKIDSTSFGQCFNPTCMGATQIDGIEPNQTKPITDIGGYTITNSTNRTTDQFLIRTNVSGATAVFQQNYSFRLASGTNPYSVPATSITSGTSAIDVQRSLIYQGAVIASADCDDGPSFPSTRPYLKVFGGDVSAGGWFNTGNTSCLADPRAASSASKYPGGVRAFALGNVPTHNFRAGSSSEYAAYGLGLVQSSSDLTSGYGFYTKSASKPANYLNPVDSRTRLIYNEDTEFNLLDFANTDSPDITANQGGRWGSSNYSCLTDYYGYLDQSGGTVDTLSASALGTSNPLGGAGDQKVYLANGNFMINGNSWRMKEGQRLTIYVTGNVYLNSDITMDDAHAVKSPTHDSSYFALIVKGNIYIDPSVQRIDGLFVAQPKDDDPNSGVINTCAGKFKSLSESEIVNQCTDKLVINGAFLARQVDLMRVGTVATSVAKATAYEESSWTANLPAHSNNPTKAAEEFNFIPEVAVGNPLLTNSNLNQRIEQRVALPPVY